MDKIIKIVQIHFSKDASGKAAWRLHNAFIENNMDSHIIFHKHSKVTSNKITYPGPWSSLVARFDNKIQAFLLRNNKKKLGLFSFPILGIDISRKKEIRNADVTYIHWVLLGFMNFNGPEKLIKLGKPVVFVMHDMWNITGGCHHSFDCEKFRIGCHNCPILPGNVEKDLSWKEFKIKLKLYSDYNNIHFISPSMWLYNNAKKSLLTATKPIYHIPNLINSAQFVPGNKSNARNALGISSDYTIISFGAVSVDSPYKGWTYLLQALEILKLKSNLQNILILIFGSGHNETIEQAIPFKSKFLGFITNEDDLINAYNASDIFVVPSIADNLPTTILESLCCGTPVVGFNVGGIPDMILHKQNGYLAEYKNSSDLAEGIEYCYRQELSGFLTSEFDTTTIINKHKKLLKDILNPING